MISGFVVNYNHGGLLRTCLRSIRFVDELIVIDKSSTDGSLAIATTYADRVITVPWSPTADATRIMALDACRGDFIVFLDGDEAFSAEAIAYLAKEARQPGSDIYNIPQRHHIIARHDERAYYWPQRQVRAFRSGAVRFNETVHSCMDLLSEDVATPAYSSNICLHNISHLNTESWIEKTNRYTSMQDRNSTFEAADGSSLVDVARQAVERWDQKTHGSSDRYVQAVAMLRAVYDIVDAVKHWEQSEGLNLRAMIAETCAGLETSYDILERTTGMDTGGSGRLRGRGGGLR
jgi:hypothetical protein